MTSNHSTLLHQLCDLILNYSRTFRATTQPTNLAIFQEQFPDEIYNPHNKIYRESLLEHTGSLPIIASFLHPYLENNVDLGKCLQMLAFHDIGETVLGDINTFVKTDLNKQDEYEIALSLIHPSQKPIFDEF
jgi:HD domain